MKPLGPGALLDLSFFTTSQISSEVRIAVRAIFSSKEMQGLICNTPIFRHGIREGFGVLQFGIRAGSGPENWGVT